MSSFLHLLGTNWTYTNPVGNTQNLRRDLVVVFHNLSLYLQFCEIVSCKTVRVLIKPV